MVFQDQTLKLIETYSIVELLKNGSHLDKLIFFIPSPTLLPFNLAVSDGYIPVQDRGGEGGFLCKCGLLSLRV